MRAGRRSSRVEGFCTVYGESDEGAAGFYWGADGSRDPFWWSGWSGLRLAGTFATLGANGLHIHQLAPREPGAEGGEGVSEELRTGVTGPSGARGGRRLDIAPHRHSDRPTSWCGGYGSGSGQGCGASAGRAPRQRRLEASPLRLPLDGSE